jgi:hypothetical protein
MHRQSDGLAVLGGADKDLSIPYPLLFERAHIGDTERRVPQQQNHGTRAQPLVWATPHLIAGRDDAHDLVWCIWLAAAGFRFFGIGTFSAQFR